MNVVRLGPEIQQLRASGPDWQDGQEVFLDGDDARVRSGGKWGDIVSEERIHRPLQVVALAAPDAADAKATASFAYTASGGGGLKLSVGIAKIGASATYTIESEIELAGTAGEASVGSLLLPLDHIVQWFTPTGARESFQLHRYRLVKLAPLKGSIGARADSVPIEDILKRRKGRPARVGGGNAPISKTTTRTLEMKIEAELALPLSSAKDPPTLSLSASVGGKVSASVTCELPADHAYDLFWLSPLAGACFVKA